MSKFIDSAENGFIYVSFGSAGKEINLNWAVGDLDLEIL